MVEQNITQRVPNVVENYDDFGQNIFQNDWIILKSGTQCIFAILHVKLLLLGQF